MRICFIDPPGLVKGLNTGLGYLASSLIQQGHQVKVLDLNNNARRVEERLCRVKDSDVIGISIKSSTAQISQRIAGKLGRKDLICGGSHATIDGSNFLRSGTNFGLAVVGEGEETTLKLMNAIGKRSLLQDVEGIMFREDNEIVVNRRRGFITDLDSLPDPNYEVFDSFNGSVLHYPLVTSRGCPHNCSYCCVGEVSGKRWRHRTPERLVKELEFAKSNYGTKSFEILDDNFTYDMKRAKEFCQLMIDHEVDLKWACYNGIRADRLDEELVALMKEAGCRTVSIGVESLNNDVFNDIGKGETLDNVRCAVNLLNEHKIEVEGSFIIGLPGDTIERTMESIRLCKKMRFNKTVWNLFVPYPSTRAWDWVKANGRLLRDWTEGFHFGKEIKSVFETEDFKEAERIHAYKVANVNCRGYFALVDEQTSPVVNAVNITRLILRYDSRNFASHMFHLLKDASESRHRIREYGKTFESTAGKDALLTSQTTNYDAKRARSNRH